jgi:hypothetical protein
MMMNAFTLLFLAVLAAATATKLWLALRQIRHVRAHRGGGARHVRRSDSAHLAPEAATTRWRKRASASSTWCSTPRSCSC